MAQVQGYCDGRFSKVRELMRGFIESGEEVGASLCVNLQGEDVVDIWGGYADASNNTPWEKDTIVNVFSTTKIVTNIACLVLISRGKLDPQDTVAKHWPEFGENGKADITIAQVLSHTAGVCGWEEKMELEDVCDSERAASKLAKQAPWWTPGTKLGYHAVTQGAMVGEIVRRIAGKSIQQFVEDEMAGPLGADFQLGARKEDRPRVGPVIAPPGPPIQEVLAQMGDSIATKTLLNPFLDAPAANTDIWMSSTLGSLNGHTNARALAKLVSCLSLRGMSADGRVELLSPDTVSTALAEHASGVDMVTGGHARRGLGVYLASPGTTAGWLPDGKVCWGSGWGGSAVVMDADRGLTIAYAMNKMASGENLSAKAYITAAYEALGVKID
ncbi:beta-lactamase/transpeptidase-like protein [Zalerion maritima]|uniref:Beta-lactamase/transpeptidase-like protein n=1 Tax=Zalerion maritima TaxID=339359 RepID=A0AAD5RKC6_9PEZI|nr:beta-lactamase/transpeptidase-like protein [Zalerion maritima]